MIIGKTWKGFSHSGMYFYQQYKETYEVPYDVWDEKSVYSLFKFFPIFPYIEFGVVEKEES